MAPLIMAGSMRMSWPAFLAARPMKKRAILSAPMIGLSAAVLRPPPSVIATASSRSNSARRATLPLVTASLKAMQQTGVTVRRRRGRGAFVAHRAAGPRGQLPAGRLGAVEHGGDLGKRRVEDVVQQEGRAFHRRQPVERQQQGERKIVGQFRRGIGRQALRVEHRLGQPGPDIDFPLRSWRSSAGRDKAASRR